jgi:hypothetical protein
VTWVQRNETSTAPIVVGGRTVTLRARSWMVPIRLGDVQLWWGRTRPDHVEILEADGRHHTLRVRDVDYGTRFAVMAGSLACAMVMRARKSRSQR